MHVQFNKQTDSTMPKKANKAEPEPVPEPQVVERPRVGPVPPEIIEEAR